MQTEREIHIRKATCTADHGIGDADRRDENAAGRVMEQFWGEQGGHRVVERLLVMKRFAHPHENDVADVPAFGLHPLASEHHLVEDLRRRQILRDAHLARGAKFAGSGAANLRRHAQRHPAGAGAHDDRFDQIAGLGAEHEFGRTVELGVTRFGHRQRMEFNSVREYFAHLVRQLGQRRSRPETS